MYTKEPEIGCPSCPTAIGGSRWPTPPRTMLLEGSGEDLLKRGLPPADANGEVMMVLDEKKRSGAGLLRMISVPTSTGSFPV